MSTHQDKENRASADEQALDELGRRWSPAQAEEPPQLLDQAVLNVARRGIEHDGAGRGLRWLGALATAAVVVLAVTLVVRQEPAKHQIPGPPKEKREASQEHSPAAETPEAPAPALSVRSGVESDASAESQGAGVASRSKIAAAASPRLSRDEAQQEPGSADADETAPMPPQEWIQRLQDLQASGETRRFLAELDAFKRTYPDYPLPPQLQNREP